METFLRLFEEHAAAVVERQLALGELLGEHNWWLDLNAGTISFGERLVCPVQVLGTEAEADQTWLWAWANSMSNIPAPLLRAAEQLRALGEREAIRELSDRMVSLDHANGHMLATVAAGVCRADAYYRCPYEGGAAFVLLEVPELRGRLDASPQHLINVFVQVASTFPINHQRAFVLYFEHRGYTLEAQAMQAEARSPAGDLVHAEFDAAGRLTALNAQIGGKHADRGEGNRSQDG
ncbi:MAG TPA: hypothetical protein VFS21_39115 [Roseiflexaceae bacterium]|nr:hypothetical protein [Roseiflexaceae bacterium]